MEVKDVAKKYKQYVIDLRREFHMYPEASFQEHRTSKRVREELGKMGIPCYLVGETGVVGIIEGAKPGKTVALRGDMDALDLHEENEVEYKSKNENYMHGCGHDGHTAMLLGAAKVLQEMKDQLKGKVKLFFQPAEELALGAKSMLSEIDDVDNILGMHVWSPIPSGKISVDPGPKMAATDIFKIRVKGKGGHGSAPHQGVDAVVIASAIVMNLQTLVSREINPLESVVVSVGLLKAGSRFNVLAGDGILEGNVRSFNPELRKELPKMIERVAKNTAASYRGEIEMEYFWGTPPTINDEKSAARAAKAVEKILGSQGVIKHEKVTGGEDFAYFLEKVPGVLALIGTGNPAKQTDYPHHHPKFNLDEDVLEYGMALCAQYALDYLSEE
jgi:amidohydrolase